MVMNKLRLILDAVPSPYNRLVSPQTYYKCGIFIVPQTNRYEVSRRNYAGVGSTPGSGAGKGGGAGGSVRESGGGLGKYGAAKEEAYFYNKQKEQLEQLKKQKKGDDKTLQKGTE